MRQLELFLGHHSCLSGPGGHSRDRSPSEFGGREDHFTCVYGVGFPRLIHLGNSLWGNLIPTPPPPPAPAQHKLMCISLKAGGVRPASGLHRTSEDAYLAPWDLLLLPPSWRACKRQGDSEKQDAAGVGLPGSRWGKWGLPFVDPHPVPLGPSIRPLPPLVVLQCFSWKVRPNSLNQSGFPSNTGRSWFTYNR